VSDLAILKPVIKEHIWGQFVEVSMRKGSICFFIQ